MNTLATAKATPISYEAAIRGLLETMKTASGRSLVVVERTGRRGEMTPLHVHTDDEIVHVLKGALTLFAAGDSVRLEAGETFVAPATTPHAFAVESRDVRYRSATVTRSAARYEDFLRAVAVPAESSSSWEESGDLSRLAAIAAPNGIDVLGAPGVMRPAAD